PEWWKLKESMPRELRKATCASRSKHKLRWAASVNRKILPGQPFSSGRRIRPGSRAKHSSSRVVCDEPTRVTPKPTKTIMTNYHKRYTPQDSAVVFIDHQPQMLFGVANADRATLINNVTLLAKVAKEFNVPAVLTAVET